MNPTRRGFLKSICAGMMASSLMSYFPFRVLAKPAGTSEGIVINGGFTVLNEETQKNMEALAETLVPWAKEVGIRDLLMEKMKKDTGLAGFVDAGLWNLRAHSIRLFKKPFYEIQTVDDRKEVIDHIIARNYPFYNRFRHTVIQIVFSNPAIWKKVSYNGPPQPRGFMDYPMPPKGA